MTTFIKTQSGQVYAVKDDGTSVLIPKAPPSVPHSMDDYFDQLSDDRIRQVAATAAYGSVSGRIAYIALGLAAKMASAQRSTHEGPVKYGDVLLELEDDETRATVMTMMGLDYQSRATLISQLLRVRLDMENKISQSWPEFLGRSMDVELARTTEVRQVREVDVSAMVEHFDGELDKDSIVAGLSADARADAQQNADRINLASSILNAIDAAPEGSELDPADELRILERIHGALMKYESDCILGKARGFGSSIERFAAAALGKGERKRVNAMMKTPRYNHGEATVAPAPNGVKAPQSSETHANRQQLAADKAADKPVALADMVSDILSAGTTEGLSEA